LKPGDTNPSNPLTRIHGVNISRNEGTRAYARAGERTTDRDLGGDFGFWLLAKAVFGERGDRSWLSGARDWGRRRIAGWAFDAMTSKRGGNEFDQIFHRGLLVQQ